MRSPKSEGTQSKNMINFETTTVGIAWKSRGVCFFNDGMLGMLETHPKQSTTDFNDEQ